MPSGRKVAALVATAAAGATVTVLAARRGVPGGQRPLVRAITVNRPVDSVYRFWRDLPALAATLERPTEVDVIDETTSRWTMAGPLASTVHWTAEIVSDEPERSLTWRVTDGPVPHDGQVEFRPAPNDRGTEIQVTLRYELPGGALTAAATKLTGDEPDLVLRGSLRRIKQILECGTAITTEGQPTGRNAFQERLTHVAQHKLAAGGRP